MIACISSINHVNHSPSTSGLTSFHAVYICYFCNSLAKAEALRQSSEAFNQIKRSPMQIAVGQCKQEAALIQVGESVRRGASHEVGSPSGAKVGAQHNKNFQESAFSRIQQVGA